MLRADHAWVGCRLVFVAGFPSPVASTAFAGGFGITAGDSPAGGFAGAASKSFGRPSVELPAIG